MRVLVTGGAGYVGSVLVPLLLERGFQVTLFDSFRWGLKPVLHFASHPGLSIVKGDVRDREAVRPVVAESDVVMHLAATVGYPACAADPATAIATNVDGTRNIVETLSEQRLIFASTGSTYGKVDGLCTEETPTAPLSLYGSTKREAERLVRQCGGVALRLATAFGVSPRLRLDLLINDFVYQAVHTRQIVLYEGHFRRSFLHVNDAARSYLLALDCYDRLAGQALNVGDAGLNHTKRDIARMVREHVEYYLHEADVAEDADGRDYDVCYDKIRELGFEATVSIDQGIRELVKVLPYLTIASEWRNI